MANTLISVGDDEWLCWKVLAEPKDGRFESVVVSDPKYCVEYKVGHFVYSSQKLGDAFGNYGLLAFGSFRSAKSFYRAADGDAIFECVGRGLVNIKKLPRREVIYSNAGNGIFYTIGLPCGKWPRGTIMFREIMLVNRVPEWRLKI